jgi:UDP-N-acetylmuramoyl-L-alanyl-D-glutamate--2,6-diaminopimelate ligase
MNLAHLLSQINSNFKIAQNQQSLEQITITDIVIDSRLVKKNSVFFALNGHSQNGENFIADAIKNGAVVVVSSSPNPSQNAIFIQSDDVFSLLVAFLKIFYFPLPANIYAITGTNGKTSTAEFTRQILEFLGKKSASIGTLGITCDHAISGLSDSALTTPDIVSLYKNLQILKKNGIDDVAIEVSSIGLEQGRVAGLPIKVGAFTNFTQDHLDYHQSMEKYLAAKMILFSRVLENDGLAVLNSDIPEFSKIKKICEEREIKIIAFGFKSSDLKICAIEQSEIGQRVFFEFRQKKYQFDLAASGEFQSFNALCALGIILVKNPLDENLLQKFHLLHPAMGRMQPVATLPNKARIFIDFAHSPDALKNILQLARKITKSRVLVLFGCGGNRDAKKRPLMGKIASDLADLVIISDDNPRQETAEAIRAEILAACDGKKTIEIPGRKEAIEKAIHLLEAGDILILAGKGHEKYQIIGDKKFEFDEEKIVETCLSKHLSK